MPGGHRSILGKYFGNFVSDSFLGHGLGDPTSHLKMLVWAPKTARAARFWSAGPLTLPGLIADNSALKIKRLFIRPPSNHLIMGDELRAVTLTGALAAGTTDFDKQSTFTNETNDLIHIKQVIEAHDGNLFAPGESVMLELSKSPTRASVVDDDRTFRLPTRARGNVAGASADEGGIQINKNTRFARGEFTLEPNESVYVNASKSSGPACIYEYVLQYEFE